MVYDILRKVLIDTKPLHVRLDKVDRFVSVSDGSRYLVLFGPEKYDAIYKSIRHLISQKSGITYIFSHNYTKIKIDSFDSLLLEETVTLHMIKIKIIITIKYSSNNVCINH